MGYVVLHLDKSAGNESAITDHIERNVIAPNVDPTRTHLNKELIDFPDGVKNRTEAIQHRIENAGLSRKVGKNQVRVIRVMLSGSTEDMLKIQAEGRLDEWCKDNMDYLKKEFGDKNVVAATLHLDEDAPHIHASIVPIVEGERRKKKSNKEQEAPKKQYKKKNVNRPRLCTDDVMARDKLTAYQDSYAEAMAKYGLERGVKGSEARHITTSEHYRDLKHKSDDLQTNIGVLLAVEDARLLRIEELRRQEQEAEKQKQLKEENIKYLEKEKQEVYDKVRDMYDRKDEVQEKYLSMHQHTQQKEQEISNLEAHMKQLKQDYEPYKAQDEINFIYKLFPALKEQLRIGQLCEKVGIAIKSIVSLLEGKTLSADSFSFFSPEHNKHFEAKNVKLKIDKEPDNPDRLQLNLNGSNILQWFKQTYKQKVQTIKPEIKRKGGISR